MELLVVVSIIAVLIAMLLPALREAQAVAKSTVCRSNLRNLGFAHAYCQDDNAGYLANGYGSQWPKKIGPYLNLTWIMPRDKLGTIWTCPEQRGGNFDGQWSSFHSNAHMGVTGVGDGPDPTQPYKLQEFDGPRGKVLLGDVSNQAFFRSTHFWSSEFPWGRIEIGRHPGKIANFVFLDGHTQPLGSPPLPDPGATASEKSGWLEKGYPPPPSM